MIEIEMRDNACSQWIRLDEYASIGCLLMAGWFIVSGSWRYVKNDG